MGKAIVQLLSSLVGHIKAGMSYVLLGSLFIVSGISGSKTSDMATIAPALFPEMKRRGHKKPAMVAFLATGAAMADTVPPSIVSNCSWFSCWCIHRWLISKWICSGDGFIVHLACTSTLECT
jgi:TRAP-type C4-dicarboxylate transport system permease large subunit